MDNLFDKYGGIDVKPLKKIEAGISLLTLAKGLITCSNSRFPSYCLSKRVTKLGVRCLIDYTPTVQVNNTY
jgi:hypothetical protein